MNIQKLKLSFVYNLWSWNLLYLGEGIPSLICFFRMGGHKMRDRFVLLGVSSLTFGGFLWAGWYFFGLL